ncbi:hypothetical protein B0H14DRAFT_2754887 [Mycena olivaceomarginata]|nr:hypothetical protein B0H14DRAFT_2754887 [Mycena olivaceomarginata]
MSPTRTLKSSRMTDRHSEQRKAREAFRRMIQQIDPEVLDILRAIRKGNIRVTKPNLHGPWRPRMQIYDDPASPNIFATFELPGVKPGDVTFDVKEGKLFIEGERRPRYPPQDTGNPTSEAGRQSAQDGATSGATEKAHDRLCPVHEFRYGEFRRTIPLPPGTETSSVQASLFEGLLTVSWPRAPLSVEKIDGSEMERLSLERPTSSVRNAEPLGDPR